jgi:hypothetical protein
VEGGTPISEKKVIIESVYKTGIRLDSDEIRLKINHEKYDTKSTINIKGDLHQYILTHKSKKSKINISFNGTFNLYGSSLLDIWELEDEIKSITGLLQVKPNYSKIVGSRKAEYISEKQYLETQREFLMIKLAEIHQALGTIPDSFPSLEYSETGYGVVGTTITLEEKMDEIKDWYCSIIKKTFPL